MACRFEKTCGDFMKQAAQIELRGFFDLWT
jgi:hypothetical protein